MKKVKGGRSNVELYKRYRPRTTDDLIGQAAAVKVMNSWMKRESIPHAIIATGPSGCGKTTSLRILRDSLGCGPDGPGKDDYFEKNCSDFRGIETIRDIRRQMNFSGLSRKKTRIYQLDEAHKLTNEAQNGMLKMLEDGPPHVYFMLSSSEPNKIIKAIHTRCSELRFNPVPVPDLITLVKRVAKREGIKFGSSVVPSVLATAADGSPRKALVILNDLAGTSDEEEQVALIEKNDAKTPGIAIARALINPKTTWVDMAKILRDTAEEEAESLRWMILSYCNTILSAGKMMDRAADIIDQFSQNFYDTKRAGLTLACYNLVAVKPGRK